MPADIAMLARRSRTDRSAGAGMVPACSVAASGNILLYRNSDLSHQARAVTF
jgi:hypothetical protein